MHTPKKSANISSTTGRMPSTAAPIPRPMNAVSEMARAVVSLRPAWVPSAEAVVSVVLIGLLPSREDVVERRLRRGNRAGLRELDRLLHPGRCLVLDGLGRVGVEDAGVGQALPVDRNRVA